MSESLGVELVTNGCELPRGCEESSPSPPQNQPVFLTAALSSSLSLPLNYITYTGNLSNVTGLLLHPTTHFRLHTTLEGQWCLLHSHIFSTSTLLGPA